MHACIGDRDPQTFAALYYGRLRAQGGFIQCDILQWLEYVYMYIYIYIYMYVHMHICRQTNRRTTACDVTRRGVAVQAEGSLKGTGADGMSAAKADKDLHEYFKDEDKATKAEAKSEEKAAGKVGLSAQAARKDAKAYFHKEQKLAEYGVGPEDDHKIVINQAIGVDGEDTLLRCAQSRLLISPVASRGACRAPHVCPACRASRARNGQRPASSCPASPRHHCQRSTVTARYTVRMRLTGCTCKTTDLRCVRGGAAMMPESMFESNPEPSDDTLDEVNQAIQAQRNEGYTNGEGMPADDVETP
jgi:hypothetical protein